MRSANGKLGRVLCDGAFNGHAKGMLALRPMRASDADRLHTWLCSDAVHRFVHWKYATLDETRRGVAQWLEDPDSLYLILLQEGQEVGFVHFEAYDPYRRQLWLSLIILSPDHIDQGIGTRTMCFLIDGLRETGLVDRVLLMVGADNGRAEKVYRRVGFEEIDRRRVRFPNGPEVDQLIMECAFSRND